MSDTLRKSSPGIHSLVTSLGCSEAGSRAHSYMNNIDHKVYSIQVSRDNFYMVQ